MFLRLALLSLSTRLTALFVVVSVLWIASMAWLVLDAVTQHFVELDSHTLRDKAALIQSILQKTSDDSELKTRLDEALQNHHDLYVWIYQGSSNLLYASASFSPPFLSPTPAEVTANSSTPSLAAIINWKTSTTEYRVLQLTVPFLGASSVPNSPVNIWIALDTHHHTYFTEHLSQTLWLYTAVAALLSGILGWWAIRIGLAPLRAIKAHAQKVSGHHLDEKISVDTVPAEMRDLVVALNDMLGRLNQDFTRLSEFSTDLAHELRTPISNLLTQTQVALAQPRDIEEYRDILASNAEEFQRLARMVSDMLFLAKTENISALPHPEKIALENEVQALFEFYQALAEDKKIGLDLIGSGEIVGDRLMVRRAISNLLANALRYTPAHGQIYVEIATLPATITLTVANTGSEIAPDILPRLFDRFFRADKSRVYTDPTSTGLGLAITQAIMRAHHGEVSAASSSGNTQFILGFPRNWG